MDPLLRARPFGGQIARRHGDSRRRTLEKDLDDGELDIGYDDIGVGDLVAEHVYVRDLQGNAVRARGLCGDLDGDVVEIDGANRSEAEAGRRDSHDTRSAAGIEQAAALEPGEKVDACARRRMRTRPESSPGIDDDRELSGRWRDPRRPDPDPAGADGAMELLPAVFPPARNGLTRRLSEGRPDLRLARTVGVRDELDGRICLMLLEPSRKALEEPRSGDLGFRARDAECDADEAAQRRALFRRLKNPSSSSRET